MIQAIGYIRRSTDRQDESLDQQRDKLRSYAASQGWKLVDIYVDDAISGSEMQRPGLRDMMQRAEGDGEIAAVLTWDRNRLARPKDPLDGLMLERRLMSAGKRIIYVGSGQEADRSFAGGLIGYVEHYQNGDYLRKLSRDTMRGMASRASQGYWTGGSVPFGYDRLILGPDRQPRKIVRDMPDRSQVILSPDTREVVERLDRSYRFEKQSSEGVTLIPSDADRVDLVRGLFRDYLAGVSLRQIRERLNAAGHRTMTGGLFTTSSLRVMLGNAAYIGSLAFNQSTRSKWHKRKGEQIVERLDEGREKRDRSEWTVIENAWPALIDRQTFEQARQRLAQAAEQQRHVTGTATRSEYLLTGSCFCGVCGGKMTGYTVKGQNGSRYRYYQCSTHHAGHQDKCPTRYTVPADLVEQHVLDLIRTDLARLRDDERLHEYIRDEMQRTAGHDLSAQQRLQQRLAELDQKIAKLRDHLLDLAPQAAKALGLYEQAESLANEREQVEQSIREASRDLPPLPSPDRIRELAAAAFNSFDQVLADCPIEQKRELVATYVHRIDTDPATSTIKTSLYPPLFTRNMTGGKPRR